MQLRRPDPQSDPNLISTGNISNEALLQLFIKNLDHLESVFAQYDFVELNATTLTIHARIRSSNLMMSM